MKTSAKSIATSPSDSKSNHIPLTGPRENAVMAEIGRIVNSSLDIDEVYSRIGDEVGKLIHFDRLSISVIDGQNKTAAIVFVTGTDVPESPVGRLFPLSESSSIHVTRTKTAQLILPQSEQELAELVPVMVVLYRAGLRSFIVVPLMSQGQMVAVMRLSSTEVNAYGEDDVRVAESIASQIAGAVGNAQQFSKIERMEQEASVLAELGRIVGSSLDIEDMYGRLGEVISRVVPYDRLVLTLTEEGHDSMSCAIAIGIEIPHHGHGQENPLADSFYADVIQRRSTTLLEVETASDLKGSSKQLIPAYDVGLRSFVTTPLIDRDVAYGVLWLQSKNRGIYTQRHLGIIEQVGNQIAGAIANSRLYEGLLTSNEELAVGDRIASIMSSGADIIELYEKFAGEVR